MIRIFQNDSLIRRFSIQYAPLFEKIESHRQQETLINDVQLFDTLPYSTFRERRLYFFFLFTKLGSLLSNS